MFPSNANLFGASDIWNTAADDGDSSMYVSVKKGVQQTTQDASLFGLPGKDYDKVIQPNKALSVTQQLQDCTNSIPTGARSFALSDASSSTLTLSSALSLGSNSGTMSIPSRNGREPNLGTHMQESIAIAPEGYVEPTDDSGAAANGGALTDTLCRHFMLGRCNRRRCRFVHADQEGSTMGAKAKDEEIKEEKEQQDEEERTP